MIRRIVTLGLCAGAFWLGIQFERWNRVDACFDAGGKMGAYGHCVGAVR